MDMGMRWMCGAVVAAMLASCGTQPVETGGALNQGEWRRTFRLVGVTADDRTIDRADVPFPLPPDTVETMACRQPMLKSLDRMNAELDAATNGQCSVTTLNIDDGLIDGGGHCDFGMVENSRVDAALALRGQQSPNSARLVSILTAAVRDMDGQTHTLRLSYLLQHERLGDCR